MKLGTRTGAGDIPAIPLKSDRSEMDDVVTAGRPNPNEFLRFSRLYGPDTTPPQSKEEKR